MKKLKLAKLKMRTLLADNNCHRQLTNLPVTIFWFEFPKMKLETTVPLLFFKDKIFENQSNQVGPHLLHTVNYLINEILNR